MFSVWWSIRTRCFCVSRRDSVSLVWIFWIVFDSEVHAMKNRLRCTFIIITDIYTEWTLFVHRVSIVVWSFYRYLLRVQRNFNHYHLFLLDRHYLLIRIRSGLVNMNIQTTCSCHSDGFVEKLMRVTWATFHICPTPLHDDCNATDVTSSWVFIIKLLVTTIIGWNLMTTLHM